MKRSEKDAAFKELVNKDNHENIYKVGKLNVFISDDMINNHPELVKKILKEAKDFEAN